MQAFEEVHPHPSAQVDGEADASVDKGEDAGPDAQVATQVEADWACMAAEDIPWAEGEGCGEEEESHLGRG